MELFISYSLVGCTDLETGSYLASAQIEISLDFCMGSVKKFFTRGVCEERKGIISHGQKSLAMFLQHIDIDYGEYDFL